MSAKTDAKEDREDLSRAQKAGAGNAKEKPWYAAIGPGLITGGADDDPSGIGTYSQCGASFGYGQLWLITLSLPLMIAVQEMCGRLGVVTGKGIAAIMKEYYPKWLLYGTLLLLFGANTLNVYADLNVMAASAKMLFGLPMALWLTFFALVLVLSLIFLPYRVYARLLKFLCLGLLGYIVVGLMPGVHSDWAKIGHNLVVPAITRNVDYLVAMVAFLGTTISPYLFFWQASEEVEEVIAQGEERRAGKRVSPVSPSEIKNVRTDTVVGMFASQTVAFFIIIATAGTLFAAHKTDINTAQDAALALRPLGPAAFWIFSICMIGTGLLSIPTMSGSVAYAISETAGWRNGLYRRFSRAKEFYRAATVVVVIGYVLNFFATLSPIKALVYSAVVNGIAAVPLIAILLLVCNNRKIVGEHANGFWSNLLGGATFLLMGGASAILIWALCTGHS